MQSMSRVIRTNITLWARVLARLIIDLGNASLFISSNWFRCGFTSREPVGYTMHMVQRVFALTTKADGYTEQDCRNQMPSGLRPREAISVQDGSKPRRFSLKILSKPFPRLYPLKIKSSCRHKTPPFHFRGRRCLPKPRQRLYRC